MISCWTGVALAGAAAFAAWGDIATAQGLPDPWPAAYAQARTAIASALDDLLAARRLFELLGPDAADALQVELSQLRGRAITLLTESIGRSHDAALAAGTAPVPPSIRDLLGVAFPETLLREVVWRVGEPGGADLATLSFRLSDAAAIALPDVIVFRNAADARNEWLWAHEMTHVEQYRRWGVDGFAARYIDDYRKVEAEADNRATKTLIAHNATPQTAAR